MTFGQHQIVPAYTNLEADTVLVIHNTIDNGSDRSFDFLSNRSSMQMARKFMAQDRLRLSQALFGFTYIQ